MTCYTRINLPGGGAAIVCSGGRRPRFHACARCGQLATLQCDWKTGKGKTCDAWICTACAMHVDKDKDLCPDHQVAFREWAKRHPDKAEAIGANI